MSSENYHHHFYNQHFMRQTYEGSEETDNVMKMKSPLIRDPNPLCIGIAYYYGQHKQHPLEQFPDDEIYECFGSFNYRVHFESMDTGECILTNFITISDR